MKFLIRWLVTALAAGVAVWIVPGLQVVGGTSATGPLIAFALVLSLVNIIVKPVVQFVSLPITCLTLGLFYLVINALMLYLAAWACTGIFGVGVVVANFGSALLGSIVISIISALVNSVLGTNDVEN